MAFGQIEYVPRRPSRADGRSALRLVAGILALVFGTFTSMLALSTLLPVLLAMLRLTPAPIPASLVAVALTLVGVSIVSIWGGIRLVSR